MPTPPITNLNAERKVKNRKHKETERQGYTAFARAFDRRNTTIPPAYENTILVGDSLILLKDMPDNCIDRFSRLSPKHGSAVFPQIAPCAYTHMS